MSQHAFSARVAIVAALTWACLDDAAGPWGPTAGYLTLAPSLVAGAAATAPITRVRVTLHRLPQATLAADSVADVAPGATTIALTLTVPMLAATDSFQLKLSLVDLLGDTALVGGPVVVRPSPRPSQAPVVEVALRPGPRPILFAGDSAAGLATGIFRVNEAATATTRIVPAAALGGRVFPRWSPDYRRVAFALRNPATLSNELLIATVAGDAVATVVSDTGTRRPRWSPNGAHLAFACLSGLELVVDVCVVPDVTGPVPSLIGVGNGPGRVVVTAFDPKNRPEGPETFAWDPTNPDRLAFVRDSLDPAGGPRSSRIYVGSFDGTGVVPLSPDVMDLGAGPLRLVGPADWSGDGARLAFAAIDPKGEQHLYLINRDGTGLAQLTAGPDPDDQPLFSLDGAAVLFRRNVGNCALDFWMINVDGSGARRLTDERACNVDIELLTADWSPDGRQIVLPGFDAPFGNLLIYRITPATTASTYLTARVLVGRRPGAGAAVEDIQPSWRP